MADLDPERLLGALVAAGVQFVLVGGYAAVVHGASRSTQDVDVTPATTADNLTRLTRALKQLQARIRTEPVPEGLPFDTSAEALSGMPMLNLTTRHGNLDLAFQPSGTRGYPDLAGRAVERSVGVLRIQVAALGDIIRSKESAGRDKDLEALTELYALLKQVDEAPDQLAADPPSRVPATRNSGPSVSTQAAENGRSHCTGCPGHRGVVPLRDRR